MKLLVASTALLFAAFPLSAQGVTAGSRVQVLQQEAQR